MSKLTEQFYESLYRQPLERFFQEFWKDESALTVLLQEVQRRVAENPEDQERLLSFLNADRNLQAALMRSLLDSGDLIEWLQKEPQHFFQLLNAVLAQPTLRKDLFTALLEEELVQKQFYGWLKADVENVRRFVIYLEKEEALKHKFVLYAMHQKLVERDEFIRWINHDEQNLKQYIQYLRNTAGIQDRFAEYLLQLGIPQALMADWLQSNEGRIRSFLIPLLDQADNRAILIQLLIKDEQAQEQIKKMVLEKLKPIDQFVQWLRSEEGNQRRLIAELRSNPDLREGLFQLLQSDVELRNQFNQSLWQDVGIVSDFLEYLGRDDEKRKAFLRELTSRDSYRSALNVMHEKEVTGALSYSLPTVTSSFPRSGSNFFQSVLRGSSGLQCLSLYHPQYPIETVYNLKSHALTPDGLAREFADMVPYEITFPQKIVYLKRDPRDVMISLYEFACFNHQQEFPMEDFLAMNYYFIANPPGKRDVKTIFYLPGPESCTVAEAFQLFTNAHFRQPHYPVPVETLLLSYEGMVDAPQETFRQAFDFLNLDCGLNPEFIRLKVSQYSTSERPRGVASGWKLPASRELYQPLIDRVNELLADEIDFLGYNSQD